MEEKREHELNISSRNHLEVSGVKSVLSFDDLNVILQSICGEITIEGKDIKISVLDTDVGRVVLDGQIDAVFYSDIKTSEKTSLIKRIFS